MNELIAFVVSFALSFWGSLQLGIVNVQVIHTTLHHHRHQAIMIAVGGVIPEFIYTLIAIYSVDLLSQNEQLFQFLQYLVVPVLIGIGLFMILKKSHKEIKPVTFTGSFVKGFVLASLNPQLITYWIAWLLVIHDYVDFESYVILSPKIAFAIGASAGAFAMLRLFIFLTERYKPFINKWLKVDINKVMGAVFILVGIFVIIKNVFW